MAYTELTWNYEYDLIETQMFLCMCGWCDRKMIGIQGKNEKNGEISKLIKKFNLRKLAVR